MYDFGNSFFVAAIGSMFLAQWLIIDNKFDDIWYGAGFALATIFVLLTSPFFGAWSDKIGKRMPFLKVLTIIIFVINGLIAVSALSPFPIFVKAIIVLSLSIIIQYVYQIDLIFHNALLENISEEQNRGKISGIGEAVNSFGWLVATIILLPFANGTITVLGDPGRHQVFLPAFIISTLLAIPMLLSFREKPLIASSEQQQSESVFKKTISGMKDLFRKDKNTGIFLIAFALISDIVMTMFLYFAVVIDSLYKVDDTAKTMFFTIAMIAIIIFGYIFGKLADKFGNKKMILISCLILVAITTLFFFSSSLWILYLSAIFEGVGAGGYYVVTRSFMFKLSPKDKLGEYFGFYSTFQRFASIFGPLIWGGIVLLFKDQGEIKYQIAGLTMIAFLVVGVFILTKVKESHV